MLQIPQKKINEDKVKLEVVAKTPKIVKALLLSQVHHKDDDSGDDSDDGESDSEQGAEPTAVQPDSDVALYGTSAGSAESDSALYGQQFVESEEDASSMLQISQNKTNK